MSTTHSADCVIRQAAALIDTLASKERILSYLGFRDSTALRCEVSRINDGKTIVYDGGFEKPALATAYMVTDGDTTWTLGNGTLSKQTVSDNHTSWLPSVYNRSLGHSLSCRLDLRDRRPIEERNVVYSAWPPVEKQTSDFRREAMEIFADNTAHAPSHLRDPFAASVFLGPDPSPRQEYYPFTPFVDPTDKPVTRQGDLLVSEDCMTMEGGHLPQRPTLIAHIAAADLWHRAHANSNMTLTQATESFMESLQETLPLLLERVRTIQEALTAPALAGESPAIETEAGENEEGQEPESS